MQPEHIKADILPRICRGELCLIGSARRECMDHVIVFNEEHLRRILSKYARYYNEVRTHLSLGKDAPCTRAIERFGDIIAQPILGGLHH
jgi:hypothetical protein